MGEHSPVDALVPSIVCEYAVVAGVDDGVMMEDMNVVEEGVCVEGWERLEWVVDERIEKECWRAEQDARALIADSDDSGLWFTDYGADWIKNIGTFTFHFSLPSVSYANDQLI
jgi:carnitine O-acetyltransferase